MVGALGMSSGASAQYGTGVGYVPNAAPIGTGTNGQLSTLAVGGATIGGNALAVTGGVAVTGSLTATGNVVGQSGLLVGTLSDVILSRDGANTLALRNGTNAQTLNVYNTYTDASNYEAGQLAWIGNQLYVGTRALGTGVARQLNLMTGGNARWTVDASGNLLGAVDATYDFGQAGANRARNGYLSGGLSLGGATLSTNALAVTGTSLLNGTVTIGPATTAGGRFTPASGQMTYTLGDGSAGTFIVGTLNAATVNATTLLKGLGTATNDNASAGQIGEWSSVTVAVGSAAALTSSTAKDVITTSLTAGDYDVRGNFCVHPNGATTITTLAAGLTTTTNTLPTNGSIPGMVFMALSFNASVDHCFSLAETRFSLASTTTVRLVGRGDYTGTALGGYGVLEWRRAR